MKFSGKIIFLIKLHCQQLPKIYTHIAKKDQNQAKNVVLAQSSKDIAISWQVTASEILRYDFA